MLNSPVKDWRIQGDLLMRWLPDQDSNLETPDPESGVLPVTPSGKIVFKFQRSLINKIQQ